MLAVDQVMLCWYDVTASEQQLLVKTMLSARQRKQVPTKGRDSTRHM